MLLTDAERTDFIQHIIKHKSEIDFINKLENYLQQENNSFKQFDWWFFSKLDETLDQIYIPYYNPKTNRIDKFKPDFIFWMKKGNEYIILFVDPKGTEHSDAYRKIDGFSRMFENVIDGKISNKVFPYGGYHIQFKLLLNVSDVNKVPNNYKHYCFDNNYDDLFENKNNSFFAKA